MATNDQNTRIVPIAYRIPEACRVVGIGKSKLYELAAEGKIRFTRIGKRTVVTHAELQRLIDAG